VIFLAFAAFFLYLDSNVIHAMLAEGERAITVYNGNPFREQLQWKYGNHNADCYVSWGATFSCVFLSAFTVLDAVLTL